ncbi:early E1A 25 kDa protein [Equine adenovirus 1]|uniref:Early E1A 25 kDa protein n=1 Tax=Equine adenovirus A serotype 1 TaxID=46916 RepID=G5CZ71_ADEE1|nr:early E1A 25 kDa protein [Equine adenovirus 1]AEP16405.1 early E1A 25 kDa protein [Equine adenovirus 1]
MKLRTMPLCCSLEAFVVGLMDEWQPEGLEMGYSESENESEPASLHDLFDIQEEVLYSELENMESELQLTLNTPPVSPVSGGEETEEASAPPETGSAGAAAAAAPLAESDSDSEGMSEGMLRCLEEMPTFDEDDEVGGGGDFETWQTTVPPGSVSGCLRCAWYQFRGEASMCGLCFLKALGGEWDTVCG